MRKFQSERNRIGRLLKCIIATGTTRASTCVVWFAARMNGSFIPRRCSLPWIDRTRGAVKRCRRLSRDLSDLLNIQVASHPVLNIVKVLSSVKDNNTYFL
jgi:hypothetical protein